MLQRRAHCCLSRLAIENREQTNVFISVVIVHLHHSCAAAAHRDNERTRIIAITNN
jgi:hypothetical protein